MRFKRKRKSTGNVLLLSAIILAALVLLSVLGWYLYDNNVDRSGWSDRGGVHSYLDFHGNPLEGWQEIDGGKYYFDASFDMAAGWQTIEGKRYYFGQDGRMAQGWQDIDGKHYYFAPSGSPVTGWQNLDGTKYHFDPQGFAETGWQEIDGERFYFSQQGGMVTGWMEAPEGRYFMDELGAMTVGLTAIQGESYFFSEEGLLYSGWMDFDDGRRYFAEDGPMCYGWTVIDGSRYYFDDAGLMVTGWMQDGEYRYFLQEDGSAATTPQEIDGQMQYFTPDGINVLLVNYKNALPKGYDADLVFYKGWTRVSSIMLQPLRDMIQDCLAAGVDVYVNCAFRSKEEQTQILENRTQEYMDQGMGYEQAYAKMLETVSLPGYSEHHTGLAADIVCSGDWLLEHCWEYGFILRYPENKRDITNIVYEKWHFRYVGTQVSMAMKGQDLCLEEYLGAA